MARLTGAAAKWAARVERLERSGLSTREFAEREGLAAGSLSAWKWKLGLTRQRKVVAEPLGFVELTPTPAASVAGPVFEVQLRSGRMVKVPVGFDAAELARLVSVLEEARA